jgi:integrase
LVRIETDYLSKIGARSAGRIAGLVATKVLQHVLKPHGDEARALGLDDTLIVFAIESGMRRSELLALRWGDVDLLARVAQVRQSKNGESREVPLSLRAVQMLKVLLKGRLAREASESARDEIVFPFTATAVRLAFERIRSRAGAPDLRFRDLGVKESRVSSNVGST